MKARILFLIAVGLHVHTYSQNDQSIDYSIRKASDPIVIDGSLNEESWLNADVADDFTQVFPTDNQPANDQTEFKITYDDTYIYFAFIGHDAAEGKYIAQSLRRDFGWSQNDNISVYIEPFGDKTNGFTFQITPNNVQREGLVTLGGSVADDWDNKWYSATNKMDDKWIAEIAVPFKSIRYNSNAEWGIQVLRNNRKTNERSAWIQVPQQYRSSDLVYTGSLNWDTPPPEAGSNVSIIPYTTYSVSRDFEQDLPTDQNFDAGFDAKVGLTNSLNLDITVNPDFSTVEVDRQVTNLNRFEIFFPERRQFFLENQDLFAQNGFPNARPFFSRRIGIGTDANGETVQSPILAGVRLSGKIGTNWRVGLLNMQTRADDATNQIPQNYTLGVFQRQIAKRSNIGAIVVNRESLNFDPNDTTITATKFNRVLGFDYNLASIDNRWEGNFFFHHSFEPNQPNDAYSNGGFIRYATRNYNIRFNHIIIGNNYNAEVGFVPRTGILRLGSGAEYIWYTDGQLQRHGPEINFSRVATNNLENLDLNVNFRYNLNFRNTSNLRFSADYNEVRLQDNFDPSRSDGPELQAGELFTWMTYRVSHGSDNRNIFNYFLSAQYGGFFNGDRLRLRAQLNARYQPFMALRLDFEYNRLEFPQPFNSTDFFLISPRLDLTFTTKLFLTAFLQYNTQRETFNLNTRLQWRFKPASDFFIVYTDNYLTSGDDTTLEGDRAFQLTPQSRGIVMKLSYWFNL